MRYILPRIQGIHALIVEISGIESNDFDQRFCCKLCKEWGSRVVEDKRVSGENHWFSEAIEC